MKERKDKTESLAYLVTGVLLVAVAVKPPRWLCQIYAILERAIVLVLGLVMAAAGLVSLARPRNADAPIAAEAEATSVDESEGEAL